MRLPSFTRRWSRVPVPQRMARGLLVVAVILAGATCRLDKLIIGPQGALLAVTPSMPDSLVDSAAFGSTAIQVDSAHITNDGGGELSWTATIKHASPWLSLDTSSGVAPYYLKVLANPTGLDSGAYRDTVVVSSTVGGGALEVPVRLNVHSCRSVPIALDDSISSALTTADCGAPHRPGRFAKLFSFPGTINDSVTIELSEGYGGFVALDTSLVPAAPPLDSTGTCLGTPGSPCLYYQRLPRNATYYIEVTSADSADTGPFTLRLLHARDPNPADSLDQRLADSVTAIDTGATISQNSVLLRAVVSDPDRGDTLHLEAEVRPTNIQFTGSPTQIGPEVTAGQIAWVQITGLSDNTSYHWCVRVVDQTGNGSECISFGGNQESETDFRVAVPTPPALPTGLGQSKGDGTPIQLGQVADTDVVLLSATVNDADPGDQIRLQVEVQPVGTPFTDSPTDSGLAVPPGPAQVFVGPLGNNTSYHWQVRASDLSGSTSAWVRFGGNPEPNGVDFTIQVPNLPNAPTTLAQFQNDGTTPITK
ncbi:MAG: BACON domain-containing protein, partial [Gemmatimonadales bacterium]